MMPKEKKMMPSYVWFLTASDTQVEKVKYQYNKDGYRFENIVRTEKKFFISKESAISHIKWHIDEYNRKNNVETGIKKMYRLMRINKTEVPLYRDIFIESKRV